MKSIFKALYFLSACLISIQSTAQTDSTINLQDSIIQQDSLNIKALKAYQEKLEEIEKQRIDDSLKRVELENKLNSLKTTDNLKKEELQKELQKIADREIQRISQKKAQIDSLKLTSKGFPVTGPLNDTLFYIYTRIGASTAFERASNITKKINSLYDDDFLKIDSLISVTADNYIDIVYGEKIIMSISETDALWNNIPMPELAETYLLLIKKSIIFAKEETSLLKILTRIGLVILIILGVSLMIWLILKGYKRLLAFIDKKKQKWLKNLSYKDYTFLTEEQEIKVILFILKIIKWFLIIVLLYLVLPFIFSIFPFTRGWADDLFQLVWSPFKSIFIAIWHYLPNLLRIVVIFIVFRYFIRFIKYLFRK